MAHHAIWKRFIYFFSMDPKLFYGKLSAIRIPNFDSEDTDLSDEGEVQSQVLAEDSDYEEAPILPMEDEEEDIIIPASDELDSTDDNLPLSEVKKILTKQNAFKTTTNWVEGNLIRTQLETTFLGSEDLPYNIRELETPLQFFKFLFPDSIIKYITEQTNIYALQCRPYRPAHIKQFEIEQFIGISIYTSIIQLPATRQYWNVNIGHTLVNSVMNCNRFEEIKRFLHFNNNDEIIERGKPGHDKLFKIRPVLTLLRERMLQVPKEEFLAVDEQIIPTKARTQLKQYNPKKPLKWGYKNFVLSGISGFCYDFDLFAGAQSNIILPGMPNLGMSSNVVVRLSETIPKHVNYKIFFDNWFSSVSLMMYLTQQGILPLGTVRLNRIPNISMPSEKEIKKMVRAHIVEKVANIDNLDISVVSWYDNKVVTTMSTYVGSQPVGEKRFFKQQNEHRMIPCPRSVFVYNNYMGGVDLLDSMLGFYCIRIRSKKFYLRIFFHFIDVVVVNSWLLARRAQKFDMPLLDTKLAITDALCRAGKPMKQHNVGRPSTSKVQQLHDMKRKKGPTKEIPQEDVRKDGIDHLPYWHESTRSRCKFPESSGKTFVICTQCQIPLCFNKDRNCFARFHLE